MRHLLLFILLLDVPAVHAQYFERHDQRSLSCDFTDVFRWNDSLWAITGTSRSLPVAGSRAVVTGLDTTGVFLFEVSFVNPGYLYTEVLTGTARFNDTLVVAGWTAVDCPANVQGYVGTLQPSGNTIWQRTLGDQPIEHLAVPDTFVHAAYADQVIVLGQSGDSLSLVTSPLGPIRRMRTAGDRALLCCDGGAVVLNGDGSVLLQRGFIGGVDDLLDYEGAGYALISNGWLFRTDADLTPNDSVALDPVGVNAALRYDQSYLWVIGHDTARFFDPGLDPSLSFPLDAPQGFTLRDAIPSPDALITAGVFDSGNVQGAAARSVGKHGEPNETDIDARLSTLAATSLIYTPLGGGQYLITGSLVAFLVNEGSVPITSAKLEYFSPMSEACASLDALGNAAGWILNPGDSIQVYLDGLSDTASTSDPLLTICLRVTAPNGLMDRDTSNDEACRNWNVFTGIGELDTVDPITLFPNPCDDVLHMNAARIEEGSTFRIMDASGREVSWGRIHGGTIAVNDLEPGTYLLWLASQIRALRFTVAR